MSAIPFLCVFFFIANSSLQKGVGPFHSHEYIAALEIFPPLDTRGRESGLDDIKINPQSQ